MINNQDPRNIFVNNRQDSYSNSTSKANSASNNSQQQTTSGQSYDKSTVESTIASNPELSERIAEMKKLAQKYQREGESQLVKDIVNNVIEQKARGNLSNEQLLQFAKRVTPLLNGEQRQRLNGLVEQLLKL